MNMGQEVAGLRRLSTGQLADRYAELFGEQPRSGNKCWLIKRIAWRMQAVAEGDLAERAKRLALEIAKDADVRLTPPRTIPARTIKVTTKIDRSIDWRLPIPGTVLARKYKGQDLQVTVLRDGFAYLGTIYQSLSALAKAITGSHVNGFQFFNLTGGGK